MVNSGRPAFPTRAGDDFVGLTKREYFAGLAMQGINASGNYRPEISALAVKQADALLLELSK